VPAITFDGPNLRIILDEVADYDAQNDIYEPWKDWARLSDNAKYPIAFDSTGGDPTSGGQTIAPYYFLRNDRGWRIRPPEADGEIDIVGNLFPRDDTLPSTVTTLGDYTMLLRMQISPQALVVPGALTDEQDEHLTRIDKMLRNKATLDPVTGILTIFDDDGLSILLEADVFEDSAGLISYRGRGVQRTEALVEP
jgi:hypothetical protein